MGLWDGIESAEIFERGNYVVGGFNGVVMVMRTLGKETRSSGLAFIVELKVMSTNLPEEHPVGQKATWFQKMTDKSVAFPAIAAWAAACAGYQPHEKERIKADVFPHLRETMKHATDNPDDNSFIGVQLRLQTTMVTTKKGGDFTRYDFSPYEPPAAQAVAE